MCPLRLWEGDPAPKKIRVKVFREQAGSLKKAALNIYSKSLQGVCGMPSLEHDRHGSLFLRLVGKG